MSDLIQFVRNYQDRSTDRGYQFEFRCDKCGNGYMSAYEASTIGTASELLRAAGRLFGGVLGQAGNSMYDIQRAVGGKAHDDALKRAVQAGKQHFHQCTSCGQWVCPEVCWNATSGLCETCAPDEQEQLAAQKAQATARKIAEVAEQQAANYVADLDFKKGGLVVCSKCGTKMAAGTKFCGECGTPTLAAQAKPKFCTECGKQIEAGKKFCAECGAKS